MFPSRRFKGIECPFLPSCERVSHCVFSHPIAPSLPDPAKKKAYDSDALLKERQLLAKSAAVREAEVRKRTLEEEKKKEKERETQVSRAIAKEQQRRQVTDAKKRLQKVRYLNDMNHWI